MNDCLEDITIRIDIILLNFENNFLEIFMTE